MSTRLYLSVIPEALIVSMLEPEAFGAYFAVGTRQRSRGQALFFDVDPAFDGGGFALAQARERCRPHADGQPKNSVYAAIYRVLERVPLQALGRLHLTTDDGRVLSLDSAPFEAQDDPGLHLYQEFCPVTPRVVSRLAPPDFARFITDPEGVVSLPRLVFCELALGALARDPLRAEVPDLPYPHLDHLRDCLQGLRDDPDKAAKMVMRSTGNELLYRTVSNGFFVGDPSGLKHYPMPSRAQLEERHRAWWRSAQMGAAS